MSRYEEEYGTDWNALGNDEAIDRAYALGVAAALGEEHPTELDRLRQAMDSAYDRSVIDLAFDEGRTEAQAVGALGEVTAETAVWDRLVAEGGTASSDEASLGPLGRPRQLEATSALERPDRDLRAAENLPAFLDPD